MNLRGDSHDLFFHDLESFSSTRSKNALYAPLLRRCLCERDNQRQFSVLNVFNTTLC